jgi:hypothetical protein
MAHPAGTDEVLRKIVHVKRKLDFALISGPVAAATTVGGDE